MNEVDAQVVQRRALRFSKDVPAGHTITEADLMALRPIPKNGISPMRIKEVLGKKIRRESKFDELVVFEDLDE
jgi:N-acetylneuraminate synthase